MIVKRLEERIVNLTKVTTDGVKATVEAELRQLKMKGGKPSQCTVILAKENNFQFTMDWDSTMSKFSTTLGGYTWYSDFDYSEFRNNCADHILRIFNAGGMGIPKKKRYENSVII